jgi:hypothetical protein
MDQVDRGQKWMLAAAGIGRTPHFAVMVIQGLGRLDIQLLREARDLNARLNSMPAAPEVADYVARQDLLEGHLTLSYLWALGGYEVIRTIDQKAREGELDVSEEVRAEINAAKLLFERVRIPLAKMEPARRHKTTDAPFPAPELGAHGVSWEVAPGVVITRDELSDALLNALLAIRADLGLTGVD